MVITCHYTMSNPKECITPRVNPNVNHRLWVMLMCQCDSSIVANGLLRWVMLTMRGAMQICGHGLYKKSPYLLDFSVNLKLKNNLLEKKSALSLK